MKYLLVFPSFIFLFSIQGFTQDIPSFEYKQTLKVGKPMGDFFPIDFSKKEPAISLDKPFDKADLIQTPVYYYRKPSEMGVQFKRNQKPEMDYALKIQQLPEIHSRLPVQKFPQDKHYTLLIKKHP